MKTMAGMIPPKAQQKVPMHTGKQDSKNYGNTKRNMAYAGYREVVLDGGYLIKGDI